MRFPCALSLPAALLASTLVPPASAQEPAAPMPPPYVATVPPTADARMHDGLYVRGSFGLGGLWTSRTFHTQGGPDLDTSTRGGIGALELTVGGTPASGLVLGGSVFAHLAPAPKTSADGETRSSGGSLALSVLAFTVDWYPRPRDGFHLGGSIGGATLRSSGEGDRTGSFDARGMALAFALGQDWWAGDNLSVGLLGRFLAVGIDERGSIRDDVSSPSIAYAATAALSVVYH